MEHCLENKLSIRECIERIRSKESRLDRSRSVKRKVPIIICRQKNTTDSREEDQKVIKLDDYKTERGYFSVPSEIWFNLSDEDKSYVKSFNGKLRKERSDDSLDDNPSPRKRGKTRNITSRRNDAEQSDFDESKTSENRRTVQFQDDENDSTENEEQKDSIEKNPKESYIGEEHFDSKLVTKNEFQADLRAISLKQIITSLQKETPIVKMRTKSRY